MQTVRHFLLSFLLAVGSAGMAQQADVIRNYIDTYRDIADS